MEGFFLLFLLPLEASSSVNKDSDKSLSDSTSIAESLSAAGILRLFGFASLKEGLECRGGSFGVPLVVLVAALAKWRVDSELVLARLAPPRLLILGVLEFGFQWKRSPSSIQVSFFLGSLLIFGFFLAIAVLGVLVEVAANGGFL